MDAEDTSRAVWPLLMVVLMGSRMPVITSPHAIAWQVVILASTASITLSFLAAMKRVNVREVSLMQQGFLLSVVPRHLPHHLPHHLPPPRYVLYFLMLYTMIYVQSINLV